MSCSKIPAGWWVLPLLWLGPALHAQTLTLQQALDAALQHHPSVKSANLQAQQQQQLLPGAGGLADPLVTVESPTGNFYTLGVTQSFSLPGVYRRQKKLQQAHIAQAESAVAVALQEIKYQTALAYTEWQYRQVLVDQLTAQDSTLQTLATAADRMFREGQTDAVAAQFARLQAAVLQTRLRQAAEDAIIARAQVFALTGFAGTYEPEPLDPGQLGRIVVLKPDSTAWQNNPALQVLEQEIQVADRTVAVAKSRGLPEFTLGYINQGERNSPVGNRFNAGVSIPLWRKQYHAQTAAARTGVEVARQALAAQSLALDAAFRQAAGEAEKTRRAMEDYEQQVLPAARAMSDASRRLYEGGLTDLITYLRNRKDALEVELEYWALVRELQVAKARIRVLTAQW